MCHWWSIICLHLRSTWDLLMLWFDLWCSIFSSLSSVLWAIELSFLRFIASDYAHVVSSNYSCLKCVIYALDGCTYVVLFTIHVQCLYCLIWTRRPINWRSIAYPTRWVLSVFDRNPRFVYWCRLVSFTC